MIWHSTRINTLYNKSFKIGPVRSWGSKGFWMLELIHWRRMTSTWGYPQDR